LIAVLVAQVVQQWGEPDGVIAFDPSSFPKRGTHSVGVADCIYNQPGLQSAHFSDHINCLYRRAQDRIMCH
jgi:hypothetical protein